MFRGDILAGKAVILVNIQDTIDKQLRSIRAKLRMFSRSLSDLGGFGLRGGLLGTIATGFTIREFVRFQDQLLFLQTKLKVSDQVMQGLERTVRNLGKSTSFTSTEVAMAATEFAKAGFNVKETANSLQAALDLARGGQVDLSTSTTILANTMRTFKIDTELAAETASKFIAAARLGTLDIVNLSESLKESSGTFGNLNVSLDDALALITQVSLSSLKATKAGTSLNTAFTNLVRDIPKVEEAFKGLVKVTDSGGELRSPLVLLTEMQAILSKMGGAERQSILSDLFNIRGARAVAALLQQGLDNLSKLRREITNAGNEARIAAEKLDSRLGGVFRRALSAFQELTLAIGSTTEGPLTKLGEGFTKVANALSVLSQRNPEFVQSMVLMPPVILAVSAGVLGLGFALNSLASALTPVIMLSGALFSKLASIVGLNFRAFKAIGGALGSSGAKAGGILSGVSTSNRSFLRFLIQVRTTLTSIGKAMSVAGVGMKVPGPNYQSPFVKYQMGQGRLGRNTPLNNYGVAGLLGSSGGGSTQKLLGSSIDGKVIKDLTSESGMSRAGRAGAALRQVIIGLLRPLRMIPKLFMGMYNFFSKGLILGVKGFKALFNTLRRVDLIHKMYVGITGVGKALKFIFHTLNMIRRTVFSASGILLIFEFLLMFGSKIPIVARGLSAIGDAFRNLGSSLGQMFKALGPGFSTLFSAGELGFSGDIDGALKLAKQGVMDIANVIRTHLVVAWKSFVTAIEPAYTLLQNMFVGISSTIDMLFSSIGAVIGSATGSMGSFLSGSGGFLDTLKQLFNTDNLKAAFSYLIGGIAEIARKVITGIGMLADGINNLIYTISDLAATLKTVFGEVLIGLGSSRLFGSQAMIDRGAELASQGSLDGLNAISEHANREIAIRDVMNKNLESINTALTRALENLQNMIYGGTSGISQNDQVAADRAAAAARATANNAAISVAVRNALGFDIGKGINNSGVIDIMMKDTMRNLASSRGLFARMFAPFIRQNLTSLASVIGTRVPSFSGNDLIGSLTGTASKGLNALLTGANDLLRGNFFNGESPLAANRPPLPEIVVPQAVKALVDSFANSRSNLLQPLRTKEEEQLEVLRNIEANTRDAADNVAVFQ